jgi:hypothetical protein
MSIASREVGSSLLIGAMIALTWKGLDFFAPLITKFIVNVWDDHPEYAPDLVGFLLVTIVALVCAVLYIVRFGDEPE